MAEGYRPAERPLQYNDLHWSVSPLEFASLPSCPVGVTVQDAVTHVLGQDPGYVNNTATRKAALFKRGLVPLSSVVPPGVCSLDDATSTLLQRDCAERFEGKLAFDARLCGNPRLYGRFLGDFLCQGFDHGWHTQTSRCSFCCSKNKDGCQRLIFDNREANHDFAQPPYTSQAGSQSLSSLQLPPNNRTFQGPRVILSAVFTNFGHRTGWDSSSVFRQLRESIYRVGYRVAWTLHSVGDIVEFHLFVVPMGWNWAVCFVQQMLEHLLPDEAGETTLRHLSPTPLWDDNRVVKLLFFDNFAALALSQADANESLTRMTVGSCWRCGASGALHRRVVGV